MIRSVYNPWVFGCDAPAWLRKLAERAVVVMLAEV